MAGSPPLLLLICSVVLCSSQQNNTSDIHENEVKSNITLRTLNLTESDDNDTNIVLNVQGSIFDEIYNSNDTTEFILQNENFENNEPDFSDSTENLTENSWFSDNLASVDLVSGIENISSENTDVDKKNFTITITSENILKENIQDVSQKNDFNLTKESILDNNKSFEFKNLSGQTNGLSKIENLSQIDWTIKEEYDESDKDTDANAIPSWFATSDGFDTQGYQMDGFSKQFHEDEDDDIDSHDPRGVSLTFVFDSTGSMWDDLVQVRKGADKILATIINRPDNPIYNYILIPFQDPHIGPVTVTRNYKQFRESLQNLQISGGGDCPEMAVGAIRKALELSLPNSYIFVFTDARSKDYTQVPDVQAMIQRKQSQVIFVLTGYCKDLNHKGYLAFQEIAATSSGQVFHIDKVNVEEILEFVRHSLNSRKVNLLSIKKPANSINEHEVLVDDSLKEFTVSVSGRKPSINVTDPAGIQLTGPPKLKPLVSLENVSVVNVQEPDPGPWKVKVSSESDHVIRSTGVSEVDFITKFSTILTDSLDEAAHRPLKGTNNSVIIKPTQSNFIQNLSSMRLLSLDGETLREVPLHEAERSPGHFQGGPFFPPYDFFQIEINGFNKEGKPIKRISPTAISAQDPAVPMVSMRPHTTGWVNDPVTLKCHVESLVPFKVMWFKGEDPISGYISYKQTSKILWHIESPNPMSEGNYTCWARNTAGVSKRTTWLSMTGPPPKVETAPQVVSLPGSSAMLHCTVQSLLKYNVTWARTDAVIEQHGPETLKILNNKRKYSVLHNDTLKINEVQLTDEGWYVCIAQSKGGRNEGQVYLAVRAPVRVTVSPETLEYSKGDTFTVTCSATGIPKPRITWKKDKIHIKELYSLRAIISERNNVSALVIENSGRMAEGIYECEAENNMEIDRGFSKVQYTEAPTVVTQPRSVLVKAGEETSFKCLATGIPLPTITWTMDDQVIKSDHKYQIQDNGILKIKGVEVSDSGVYVCLAENKLGTDKGTISLEVGMAPRIVQIPTDIEIRYNGNGSIPCLAIGLPAPTISWLKSDGTPVNSTNVKISETGNLMIRGAKVEDSGAYICRVENKFSVIDFKAEVKIVGLASPVLDTQNPGLKLTLIHGESMKIPCEILIGEPLPDVEWYKDGELLKKEEIQWSGVILLENNILFINYATKEIEGLYSCIATNIVGSATKTIHLQVLEPPKFNLVNDGSTPLNSVYTIKAGDKLVIPCNVQGNPKPLVTWHKDKMPLLPSSSVYKNHADNSLVIRNASKSDSGSYVCRAENSAGTGTKAIAVFVQVPPNISPGQKSVTALEGQTVSLLCEVEAVPLATVDWYKNGELMSPLHYDITLIGQKSQLRFLANFSDNAHYKCVAVNEIGSDSWDTLLTVIVPPSVYQPQDEYVKASLNSSLDLQCLVSGFPQPQVTWYKNGLRITNDSNMSILQKGTTLTIHKVQPESAGIYMCDIQNIGGITEKTFYIIVHVQPKIWEDLSSYIQLMDGEDYAIPCSADGIPTPKISWEKEGKTVTKNNFDDLTIHEDGTLLITSASTNTTGIYSCVAENVAGRDEKHYIVEIMIPPSMLEMETTKLEVVEGDPVALTCPTISAVPPPTFQWLKEGVPLHLLASGKSDREHFVLKDNNKILQIGEVRSSDNGSYSCIASNVVGKTEVKFTLNILAFPQFEELSHKQLRNIVESKALRLDCFVIGNPAPKVTWKKNNIPLTINTAPGIIIGSNGQTMSIPNIKVHDTGNYQCLAQNKVGFIERDFHVRVIVPPKIDGILSEYQEVTLGEPVLLQCPISGIPDPKIEWLKDGHSMEFKDIKDIILSSDRKILEISSVEKYDQGVYICRGTNTAGSRTKLFNITILEPPIIAQEHFLEEIKVREGEGTDLLCRVSGHPVPDVMWLHNGHVIDKHNNGVDIQYINDNEHLLSLRNVAISDGGKYTCHAASKVGVAEKHFKIKILVAPRLSDHGHTINAFEGLPISIKCPVVGNPDIDIHWMKNDQPINEETLMEESEGAMLHISSSRLEHSGNYTCIAENNAGNVSTSFQLDVMAPPLMMEKEEHEYTVKTGEVLKLYCNVSGHPPPKIVWLKGASEIKGHKWINAQFEDYDRRLVIPQISMHHSGKYSCLAINMAGETEMTFNVDVHEPPYNDEGIQTSTNYSVKLHRRLVVKCPLSGSPQPKITWYKDGVAVNSESDDNIHISTDGQQLHIMQASMKNSGEYSCLAENSAGSDEVFFSVNVEVPMEWSPWSPWSECSATCGPGVQVRVRSCGEDVEPNLVDTKECPGDSQQVEGCHMSVCPIDGSWSEWSNWTSCSETCGRATRRRYRKCNNPVPAYGGRQCYGSDAQQEICHQTPCAIHGQWSDWSAWSECTASCGEGKRYRTRECNNPAPAYGGNSCDGPNMDISRCNIHKCPVHGSWSPWGDWTSCSVTCGAGNRRRYRTCTNPPPQFGGALCSGENLQVETCAYSSCRDVPSGASIRIHGRLNGQDIPENIIDTRIIDHETRRVVTATVDEVLRHKASWFPYLPFILSPVLWNTAKEQDEANNGYSLTSGNFRQSSLFEFVTGEELVLNNNGQGVSDDGTLQVDIEVDGAVPMVQPEASVVIDTITEDFIQTSLNTLFSSSKNEMNINGKRLSYSKNNTIHYDTVQGTMPYLVEELLTENMGLQYDTGLQEMKYIISTTIRKKFNDNKCPDGFIHDEKHLHCRDINECRDKGTTRCHHTQSCENLFGSYRCYCRSGFKPAGDDSRCLDINECLQDPPPCSQHCKNRKGGYKCLCFSGYYLLPDGKSCAYQQISSTENEVIYESEGHHHLQNSRTLRPNQYPGSSYFHDDSNSWRTMEQSWRCPVGFEEISGICQDINECHGGEKVCNSEQTCLNTKGSFKCLETPCPDGYEKEPDTGNCNKYCDNHMTICEDGAQLMQSIIYTTLTPRTHLVHPYQDLMVLTVNGEDGNKIHKTRFRIVENETGKPFRVRFESGQGVLYSLKTLVPDKVHRLSVLAVSYDDEERNILYTTKFIIFILVSENP